MIYNRFSDLLQAYHRLESGDVFIGRIPSSQLKSVIMADLVARGVNLVPSAVAQLLHASKVAQAHVLQPWMLPHTRAITRRRALVEALGDYRGQGIAEAITKDDGLHCGQGIRKWSDLEMLYNCLGLNKEAYPFVLQPFEERFLDIRVIWVGDFFEAYSRDHPTNFRKNLAGGGRSRAHKLSPRQHQFCSELMVRSQMPFAHIDLMVTEDGGIFLSEIRMNGGIHGARIPRRELERLKQERLKELIRIDRVKAISNRQNKGRLR